MDRTGTPMGVISQYEPRTCETCQGARGATETERDGNVVRQTWRSCSACGGQGVR
ncbi:hypothetical protein [Streptomyces sp. NPDC053048]|uniref:hypothetical protein n=1 Tax=Streptomyces sp. NPDC053048 TaxID=3365694 RepID=UPI0037CEBEE6